MKEFYKVYWLMILADILIAAGVWIIRGLGFTLIVLGMLLIVTSMVIICHKDDNNWK